MLSKQTSAQRATRFGLAKSESEPTSVVLKAEDIFRLFVQNFIR